MDRNIALFSEYIKNKKLSNNTQEAYIRDITNYMEYLSKNEMSIYDIDNASIEAYVSHLKKNKKANSSIARNISVIKSFLKFLISKGVVLEDPRIDYEIPKVERKIPKILSVEEVEKLLNAPDISTVKGKRDKAMLELMYACGLKVSELLNLAVFDINLEQNYILCNINKKERIIPMGHYAVDCIKNYLTVREEVNKNYLNLLFFNNKGNKMSRQGFWKIIKLYAEDAGIDKNINSYTLRHSFAVHLIENGANLSAVQRLLGHTNMSAIQVYSDAVKNIKVIDIYKNSHPRA